MLGFKPQYHTQFESGELAGRWTASAVFCGLPATWAEAERIQKEGGTVVYFNPKAGPEDLEIANLLREMVGEVDMVEAMRPLFEAGKGVVFVLKDMPDGALLLAIKQAASFGKPFTVVPTSDYRELGRGAGFGLCLAGQSADDLKKLS